MSQQAIADSLNLCNRHFVEYQVHEGQRMQFKVVPEKRCVQCR